MRGYSLYGVWVFIRGGAWVSIMVCGYSLQVVCGYSLCGVWVFIMVWCVGIHYSVWVFVRGGVWVFIMVWCVGIHYYILGHCLGFSLHGSGL